MARSGRLSTSKITIDPNLQKPAAENLPRCPYCKKELTSAEETACPHCGLPIRRRKRQRQITTHGGSLAKIVLDIPGEEHREIFLSEQVTSIGRADDNLIQIQSPIISNEHARIEFSSKGHSLIDLGSTNGTRVNGQQLLPHKSHLLAANDIIRFGDGRGNSVKLTYLPPSSYTHVDTKNIGRSYQLETDVSYIGRGFDATIVLSHPTVSWYHSKITKQGENQYVIEDISTQNATFLNGARLSREQLLARGDVVQIGPFNLIYQDHGLFSSFLADRNFRLEVLNLEKTVYGANLFGLKDVEQPKQILRNLNLVINPREFVALVGGSGSGKSTLMKALIGLNPASAGAVLVNGDDLYEHLELYRNLIGYVPQDDIVHLDLKVRQALRYAYQLRLPPATSPAEIEKHIDEALAKVGLSGQADTLVRDLSGGQRKRVSIAAELLADPWIFFLDEPTSGLDPGLEKLMMDTLRRLADEGRTIILVTHATSHILDHCDQVAFMAGGELAFFGPPGQAIDFFKVNNFPDIYTALAHVYPDAAAIPSDLKPGFDKQVSGDHHHSAAGIDAGSVWAEHYRQSELYQTYITHRQSGEVARPISAESTSVKQSSTKLFGQFKILAQRYLELIKADRLSLWILLAVMPLIGLFLLLITERSALVGHTPQEIAVMLETVGSYSIAAETQTVLFMLALSTSLLGIFGAAYELIKEEPIYRRERMLGLRVVPYFASKFTVLGAFMALQTALFLIVLALRLHFPGAGALFWAPLEYYLTLLLTVLASIALGLFISALASSKEMVTSLMLVVILGQIVFSGAIFELPTVTQFFSYLTITRWSLEALGISTDIESLNNLGQVRVEHLLDTGRGIQTLIKDVPTPLTFYINYTHNGLALLSRWILLLAQVLIWSQLTLWQIRRKDQI